MVPFKVKLHEDYIKRGLAMSVPGSYWDGKAPGWFAAISHPRSAAIALALFPELGAQYPELAEARDSLYGEARPTDFATEYGVRLGWTLPGITPHDFQAIDTAYLVEQARRLGGGFLGWDRGLGKTMATLAMAQALDAQRILIVCGNTMKQTVWGREIAAVWPEARVSIIPNEKKKREAWVREQSDDAWRGPEVSVVHYEALALIAGDQGRGEGWKKLGRWDVMAFDESHRLASMQPGRRGNTNLGRATMKARKQADVAFALTGTAIMNKGDDLFGQLHFLFPDVYKTRNRDFTDRFLEYVDTEYRPVCIGFKADRLDVLRDELGVFMCYRTKADELDLPERIIEDRMIDLGPAQRKAYDELVSQWWTQIDSGEVIKATNAISMLTRLRQVATGLSAAGTGVDDSTKLDFAQALIEDNPDEAYVVLSWYKAPIEALAARLGKAGIDCFVVDGDVPHAKRAALVEAFQAGEGRVFLGTISTLGESVNLQRASSMILLDRSWNPAQNAQAMDRIYRIGQDKRVTVTNLIAKDTVDELRVQPVLASKDAIRASVFGGGGQLAVA